MVTISLITFEPDLFGDRHPKINVNKCLFQHRVNFPAFLRSESMSFLEKLDEVRAKKSQKQMAVSRRIACLSC
jgi:hypothetical protein